MRDITKLSGKRRRRFHFLLRMGSLLGQQVAESLLKKEHQRVYSFAE